MGMCKAVFGNKVMEWKDKEMCTGMGKRTGQRQGMQK